MAKPSASQSSTKSRRNVIGGIAGSLLLLWLVMFISACKTRTNSEDEKKKEAIKTPAPEVNKSESSQLQTFTEDLGNGVKLEMVRVPGGTFQMGSNTGEVDEKPAHQVTVSAFAMGKYEVTQAQWQAVMGENLSNFKGDDLPVENVSWDDAQEFCRKLSSRTGQTYRLPTEAEWEYACRAGSTGDYAGNLDAMAWYRDNAASQTHPVGQKQANKWGLYDMHGNVREWCQDWYHSNYYNPGPAMNPQGPSSGSRPVLRGGSWDNSAASCRSAIRYNYAPGYSFSDLGVRLLRTAR